ncbi:MAG: nuclear transport factor 2 family protein [Bacteroidota bacterium]
MKKYKMKALSFAMLTLAFTQLLAQRTSISYELNGRAENRDIQENIDMSENPFAKFIGEWTLKDDTWIQNWGGDTDTLTIPRHHTISCQINTDNSLLSIVDGPEPNGHIFWSYNPNTGEVGHLSSFGTIRMGVGQGEFYDHHNLRLKVSFEGEGPGTYRMYTYEWVNDAEYALYSEQFDENDNPTGLFYAGNFIRVDGEQRLRQEIEAILDVLDNNEITKEEQLAVYADDIIHMAPNQEVISNKEDLLSYLNQQASYGYADMEHTILEYARHGNIIVMRGEVEGLFYPVSGDQAVPFRTKNMFIFERISGDLKVSKVIYNMSPTE